MDTLRRGDPWRLTAFLILLIIAGVRGEARGADGDGHPAGGGGAATSPGDDGVLRVKGVEIRPDVKFYSDYQVEVSDEDLANAFHITRAYLGVRLGVTDWLGARVTYDVTTARDLAASGDAAVTEDGISVSDSSLQGSLVARLKYAYVDVGIRPARTSLRVGVVHTPTIDWLEHVEGSRFLRKVMVEEVYGYPSADAGFAFVGHAGDALAYHVGLYNGEGYHGLEDVGFKDVAARVSLRPVPASPAVGGLQLTGFTQIEFPGDGVEPVHRRFGGAVTWRLAGAILDPDCHKVVDDRAAAWIMVAAGQEGSGGAWRNDLGLSVGARVELPAHLFLIARGDRWDPDLGDGADERWDLLGAFGVRAHRTFSAALAYQARLPVSGEARHLVGFHTEFHL